MNNKKLRLRFFFILATGLAPTCSLALGLPAVKTRSTLGDRKEALTLGPIGANRVYLDDDKSGSHEILTGDNAPEIPIVTMEPEKVCMGEKFRDRLGRVQEGNRPCKIPTPCTLEGQTDCLVTDKFVPADKSVLVADNLKSGVVVAGVTGTMIPAPQLCDSNGTQNCVVAESYFAATACAAGGSNCFVSTYVAASQPLKAISFDEIEAGKGAMGATLTLGGVSGTLLNCASNHQSDCIANSSFPSILAQCTANDRGSCEGDPACRWSGGACEINPWNIRAGASIAGQMGTLKLNCRNTINPTYWDTGDPRNVTVDGTTGLITLIDHGFASNDSVRVLAQTAPGGLTLQNSTYYVIVVDAHTFKLSASSGPGSAVNITSNGADVKIVKWQDGTFNWWDTVNDFYGVSSTRVTGWSANTLCESEGWSDVTTLDGGQTFTSCGTGNTCIYKDLTSGLQVSGILASGGNTTDTTTPATYHWAAAVHACATSTYGGYGAGSWRLATQKEALALYMTGLVALTGANFMSLTNLQSYVWTSTTSPSSTNGGYFLGTAGSYQHTGKSSLLAAFCVK